MPRAFWLSRASAMKLGAQAQNLGQKLNPDPLNRRIRSVQSVARKEGFSADQFEWEIFGGHIRVQLNRSDLGTVRQAPVEPAYLDLRFVAFM